MDKHKKLRVIVCGTTFGRIYIDAIRKLSNEYELIGILAKGSDHSKKIAKHLKVNLYDNVDNILKSEVDLACIVIRSTVVGGSGSEIAKKLLKKGINVIQEHPVHSDDLIECFKLSQKYGCMYKVNGFYKNLSIIERFLKVSKKLKEIGSIRYIEGSCAIQVLYPMVEIIGKITNGFKPYSFQLSNTNFSKFPLKTISGSIKNIPVQITIQNQLNAKDPDNNGQLLHRLVIATSLGNLMLTNSHGPVIWHPNMFVPRNESGLLDIYGHKGSLEMPIYEEISCKEGLKQRCIFTELWTYSLKSSLKEYYEDILKEKKNYNDLQFTLSATQLWQEWSQMIGTSELIDKKSKESASLEIILGND